MKQMVMFEPSDLALLRQGKSLTLRVGDQDVTLGYAGHVTTRRNGGRSDASTVPAPMLPHRAENDRVCPTCGRANFRLRRNMLEHHRRVHGRSAPTAARSARRTAVYAADRYRAVLAHAYGTDRCSACKKPATDLRLFPATREGWVESLKLRARGQHVSAWAARRQVAEMIQKDGMGATKKRWHYGCRSCMHRGANAAKGEV